MANIFLDSDEVFNLTDGGNDIFGRPGGNEGVLINGGTQNTTFNAELERIDTALDLAAHSLEVTGDNELQISANGNVIATVPSINGTLEIRAQDGNINLEQTGAASFEAINPNDDTDTAPIDDTTGPVTPGVGVGNDTSQVPTGGGGTQPPSDSSTLSANADTFQGTDGDDTIFAPLETSSGQQLNTFNAVDTIDAGKDGKDGDTLEAVFPGQGAGFGESFIRPQSFNEVENFDIQTNFADVTRNFQGNITNVDGLTFDWDRATESLDGALTLRSSTGPVDFLNTPSAADSLTMTNLQSKADWDIQIESGVLEADDSKSKLAVDLQDVAPQDNDGPGNNNAGADLVYEAEEDADVGVTEVNLTSKGSGNDLGVFDVLTEDAQGKDDTADEVLTVTGPGDLEFNAGNVGSQVSADVVNADTLEGDLEGTFDRDDVTLTSGEGDDTLTFSGDNGHDVATAGGKDTVTVTGDGDDTVSTGKGIDFVGFQGSGDHTVELGEGADRALVAQPNSNDDVTAGEGDDVVSFRNQLNASDSLDGEGGTDTIAVSQSFNQARSGVSNVETLQLGDELNNTQLYNGGTYEVDELTNTDIDTVELRGASGNVGQVGGAGANVSLTDLEADTTVEIRGSADAQDRSGDGTTGIGGAPPPEITQLPGEDDTGNNVSDDIVNVGNVQTKLKDASGNNDSLDFVLGRDEASPARQNLDELRMGTLTAPNIENITIESTGDQISDANPTAGGQGLANSFTAVQLDSVQTLDIDGDKALGLDAFNNVDPNGTLKEVDASDLSGQLVIAVNGNQDGQIGGGQQDTDTVGVSLTGGSGNDGLFGGAEDDTIVGGPGNDQIDGNQGKDDLRGGAGSDTFIFDEDQNVGTGPDAVAGDEVDGEGGTDTIKIDDLSNNTANALNVDLTDVSVDSIESFTLGDTQDRDTSAANAHTVQFADSFVGGTDTTININAGNDADKSGQTETIIVQGNKNTTDLRDLDINGFDSAGDGDRVFVNGDSDATNITGTQQVDVIDSGQSGTSPDQVAGQGGNDIFLFTEFDTQDTLTDFVSGSERLVIDADNMNAVSMLVTTSTANVITGTASSMSYGAFLAMTFSMVTMSSGPTTVTATTPNGATMTATASAVAGVDFRSPSTVPLQPQLGQPGMAGNTATFTFTDTATAFTNFRGVTASTTVMTTQSSVSVTNGQLGSLLGRSGALIGSTMASLTTLAATFGTGAANNSALSALSQVSNVGGMFSAANGTIMASLTNTTLTGQLGIAFAQVSDAGNNNQTDLIAWSFSAPSSGPNPTTVNVNTITIAELGQGVSFSQADIYLA